MSESPRPSLAARLNARFVALADFVSWGMGTPTNIAFWILAVLVWFVLFAVNPAMEHASFLPPWFTSNAFNFPLNSITTLAELYIGFLVAAAANRSERALMQLLHHMETMLETQETILDQLEKQSQALVTDEEAIERQLGINPKGDPQ